MDSEWQNSKGEMASAESGALTVAAAERAFFAAREAWFRDCAAKGRTEAPQDGTP